MNKTILRKDKNFAKREWLTYRTEFIEGFKELIMEGGSPQVLKARFKMSQDLFYWVLRTDKEVATLNDLYKQRLNKKKTMWTVHYA